MTRSRTGRNTHSAVRMLRMLQRIPRNSQDSRGRISASALRQQLVAEGFDVSLRTVQRNLQQLQSAFPNLCNDGVKDQLG